jgi:uncharacterized protein (DUF1330 family)
MRFVDPQYSLLHGVTTSHLERVVVNVGAPGSTVEVGCEVPILKHCADNLSIKSVHDVYTKRFTQLGSYGRACNNVLAGGEDEIPELANNIIKFCSYGHTNLTLTCANWEVTQAESIIAGYNISDAIVSALKNILKKRPLVVPVEKYEINHFSGTFKASGINIQSVFSFVFTKTLVVLFPRKANILTCFTNPNFDQFHVEMRNNHYPISNISTVDVEFFKINMEAVGLNDF